MARNGTTWLSNTLCRHPDIAGVQSELHWGFHESKIYKNKKYFGDLKDINDYIKFLEIYSSSDHFKLAKGDKEHFYENRFENFYEFFLELMDEYAKKEDCGHWITKLDPQFYSNIEELNEFLDILDERYEKYKLISIKRDLISVLESNLNFEDKLMSIRKNFLLGKLYLGLRTAVNINHYREIKSITSNREGLEIIFDDFKNNHEEKVKEIMEFLNLTFDSSLLEQRFQPNSSFKYKSEDMVKELNILEKTYINNILKPLFSASAFLRKVPIKLRDRFADGCPLYWRVLKSEYMEEEFAKELKENNRYSLYKKLFDEE